MDLKQLSARDGLVLIPDRPLPLRADRLPTVLKPWSAESRRMQVRPEANKRHTHCGRGDINCGSAGSIPADGQYRNDRRAPWLTSFRIGSSSAAGEERDESKLAQSSHMAQCFHQAAASHILKGDKTIHAQAEIRMSGTTIE
jgi:hypothetical protein